MNDKVLTGLKVSGAAVLAFIGNTLEESREPQQKLIGKVCNTLSSGLLLWAGKDMIHFTRHQADDDHAV